MRLIEAVLDIYVDHLASGAQRMDFAVCLWRTSTRTVTGVAEPVRGRVRAVVTRLS